LEIPGGLQFIGAQMCLTTTELLLTKESRNPKFEIWKTSFLCKRDNVMGKRTGHEMEHGNGGGIVIEFEFGEDDWL
jgi:hypothetical protein